MENPDQITTDAIFDVLSSSRRRRLLFHLHRHGGEAHLRDLAEETAADEFGEPLEEEQIKRIYIAFYQTHIPKLEEVGFVSYDRDEQWVVLEDAVLDMARVLPNHTDERRMWPMSYGVIGVVALLISAVSMVNATAVGGVMTVSVVAGAVGIALIVLSAMDYMMQVRRRSDYSFLERLVNP